MSFVEMLLSIAEIVGIAAFAAAGAIVSIKRSMDVFGVVFLGIVTALGGGTVRDIILGCFPPKMFSSYKFLAVAAVSALAVFVFAYIFKDKYLNNLSKIDAVCNVFDAVGLAVFSVTGVSAAISSGFLGNPFLCVFLGMTTGVGGGIIRDMMSKAVPFVLKKRIYALASIAGSFVYWLMVYFSAPAAVSLAVAVVLIIAIRIFATCFKWDLPKVAVENNENNKK